MSKILEDLNFIAYSSGETPQPLAPPLEKRGGIFEYHSEDGNILTL